MSGRAGPPVPVHICKACGTSYPASPQPPPCCPICEDERQFVPRTGQAWTTPDALARTHANTWRVVAPGLLEIHTEPDFAIGQRALLLRTPHGNYLWDCIALIDDATVELVRALGGLAGVAVSHPHYYTRCQDWADVFDCPVHLHEADRRWVMRPSPAIRFWSGDEAALAPGLTLLRLGGHFPGASVLHWAAPRGGHALLTGDTIQVSADPCRVSFMWSYPNRIPLSAGSVRRIADRLKTWRIDRIHGFSVGCEVWSRGGAVIAHSARRYIDLLGEEH